MNKTAKEKLETKNMYLILFSSNNKLKPEWAPMKITSDTGFFSIFKVYIYISNKHI